MKQITTFTIISLSLPDSVTLLLLLLLILCRAASSAALSHTGGFRVGGGVHDSYRYTFQCGLVGSFTSRGIIASEMQMCTPSQ